MDSIETKSCLVNHGVAESVGFVQGENLTPGLARIAKPRNRISLKSGLSTLVAL